MKGIFLELTINNRVVFACATNKITSDEFSKIWEVCGQRLYRQAEEVIRKNEYLHAAQIRMSPITD